MSARLYEFPDPDKAGCILINTGADFEKWSNLEGSAFQDGAS